MMHSADERSQDRPEDGQRKIIPLPPREMIKERPADRGQRRVASKAVSQSAALFELLPQSTDLPVCPICRKKRAVYRGTSKDVISDDLPEVH